MSFFKCLKKWFQKPQEPVVESDPPKPLDLNVSSENFSFFDLACEFLYKWEVGDERGWSDHDDDKGGLTRWGLSSKAHPDINLDTLYTFEDAKPIYYSDYWIANHLPGLPSIVPFMLFDAIVQHGRKNPVKWIQDIIGVDTDGILGPKTTIAIINAVKLAGPLWLIDKYMARRLQVYGFIVENDESQRVFFRGWMNRMANLHTKLVYYAIKHNKYLISVE